MANRHFDILIVGGGQAGRRAAEGARAVAAGASIGIIGEEPHPPYDRPPLSKQLLLDDGDESLCFRCDRASYDLAHIDLILGERVDSLDLLGKRVRCASDAVYSYGKLILATGSRPRTIDAAPDVNSRVTVLRTLDDAVRLKSHLRPGKRFVVIGAGFIGLEVASAAIAKGARVAVLEAGERVLGRVFPREAADLIEDLHRVAGVDLRLSAKVSSVRRAADAVCVETNAGAFEGDIVVVGIGVSPNVELAQAAGLTVDDGIVVSADGATSHPDVFAAGEVTRHPTMGAGLHRLECWQVAEQQAEAAGRSAAGAPTAYAAIPYFWSDQLGVNIQMFGLINPHRRIITRQGKGTLMFALDQARRIEGAIGFNAGADMSAAKRLIGLDAPIELADSTVPLRKILRSAMEV